MMSLGREAFALLSSAARQWSADAAPRLAAAISFYAVLSIVPLVMIAVAVAGVIFGHAAASNEINLRLAPVIGPDASRIATRLVTEASKASSSVPATIFGLGVLMYAASHIFAQIKGALDVMWGVPEGRGGVRHLIRSRLVAFALVGATGLLLVASVLADAVRAVVVSRLGEAAARPVPTGDTLLSFLLLCILVTVIYKVLPDSPIGWREVLIGALFTSVLLMIGMRLLGLYFTYFPLRSIYGAAGSIVAILVWVHYSSMVFLYGAAFAHVFSVRHGARQSEEEVGFA
jgi:membrane protein